MRRKETNLVAYSGLPCYYCNRPMIYKKPRGMTRKEHQLIKPTRDHVIPRSVASGIKNNIVICCGWCNQLKDNGPYEQFVLWVKAYRRET